MGLYERSLDASAPRHSWCKLRGEDHAAGAVATLRFDRELQRWTASTTARPGWRLRSAEVAADVDVDNMSPSALAQRTLVGALRWQLAPTEGSAGGVAACSAGASVSDGHNDWREALGIKASFASSGAAPPPAAPAPITNRSADAAADNDNDDDDVRAASKRLFSFSSELTRDGGGEALPEFRAAASPSDRSRVRTLTTEAPDAIAIPFAARLHYGARLALPAVTGVGGHWLLKKQRNLASDMSEPNALLDAEALPFEGLIAGRAGEGGEGRLGLAIIDQLDYLPKGGTREGGDVSCFGSRGGGGGIGSGGDGVEGESLGAGGATSEDAEMRKIFALASPDENGCVTQASLTAALPDRMSAVLTDHAFALLDEDGDGLFTFKEISCLLARCYDESDVRKMRALFDRIDADGSGEITGAELQSVLPHVTQSQMERLMAEFDENHDGCFTWNEVQGMYPRLKEMGAEDLPIPYGQALCYPIDALKSTSMEMAQCVLSPPPSLASHCRPPLAHPPLSLSLPSTRRYFLGLRFMTVMLTAMCGFGAVLLICNLIVNDILLKTKYAPETTGPTLATAWSNDTVLGETMELGFLSRTSSFPSIYLASFSYSAFLDREAQFNVDEDDSRWSLLACVEVVHTATTICILAFLVCALGVLGDRIRASEELLDKGVITCSDFTVEVMCIPPSATATQLAHLFRRWGPVAKVVLHFPSSSRLMEPMRDAADGVTHLRFLQRREEAEREVEKLSSRASTEAAPSPKSSRASDIEEELRHAKRDKSLKHINLNETIIEVLQALEETVEHVEAAHETHKPMTNPPTPFATAFISFEHEDDRAACEHSFRHRGALHWPRLLFGAACARCMTDAAYLGEMDDSGRRVSLAAELSEDDDGGSDSDAEIVAVVFNEEAYDLEIDGGGGGAAAEGAAGAAAKVKGGGGKKKVRSNPFLRDQRWAHFLAQTPAHWETEWNAFALQRLNGACAKHAPHGEPHPYLPADAAHGSVKTLRSDAQIKREKSECGTDSATGEYTRCSTIGYVLHLRARTFCGCSVHLNRAPEPEDILWENLHIATCSKLLRYVILIATLTLFCILVSVLSGLYILVSGFSVQVEQVINVPTWMITIAPLTISQINLITKLSATKVLVPMLAKYIRYRSESQYTAAVLVCTFLIETMQTAFLIVASFTLATMTSRPYSDGDLAGESGQPVPLADIQTGNNVMQALGYLLLITSINTSISLILMDSPGMLPVWIGRVVGVLIPRALHRTCNCGTGSKLAEKLGIKALTQHELNIKWRAPESPIHIWTSKLAAALIAVCAVGPWYPLIYFAAAAQVASMFFCELWALLKIHSNPRQRGFEVAKISATIYQGCIGVSFLSTLFYNWINFGGMRGQAGVGGSKFWAPILLTFGVWLIAAVVVPIAARVLPRFIRRFLPQRSEEEEHSGSLSSEEGVHQAGAHEALRVAGEAAAEAAVMSDEIQQALPGTPEEQQRDAQRRKMKRRQSARLLTSLLGDDPDDEPTWHGTECEYLMQHDSSRLNASCVLSLSCAFLSTFFFRSNFYYATTCVLSY